MPLLADDGRLLDDPWAAVADDAPLPEAGPVLVSLDRFHAEREALLARGAPVGVRLRSHELAPRIGPDVGHLALIAIEFPTFRDGRGYSTARLLRERFGFAGELRAVGDVLRDQVLFMRRCGFDTFEAKDAAAAEGMKAAMSEFTVVYQPAGDGRVPAFRLRHAPGAAE